MRKLDLILSLAAASLFAAAPLAAQGGSWHSGHIPRGQLPPRGMCRIWVDGMPPGRQPAPTDCATAERSVPPNGRVLFSDGTLSGYNQYGYGNYGYGYPNGRYPNGSNQNPNSYPSRARQRASGQYGQYGQHGQYGTYGQYPYPGNPNGTYNTRRGDRDDDEDRADENRGRWQQNNARHGDDDDEDHGDRGKGHGRGHGRGHGHGDDDG